MTAHKSGLVVKLVYSYCHKDTQYRESMETSLKLLKSEGLLEDWSDESILPGRSISSGVRQKMDNMDIMAFLISPAFLASPECMKKWKRAEELALHNPLLFRVPIIVRDCAWKDFLGNDDLKALPKDGLAIVNFNSLDTAWLQVYEGIKEIVNQIRNNFSTIPSFLEEMQRTDFIAQQNIKLTDVFVFLPLLYRTTQKNTLAQPIEKLTNQEDLLSKRYALIHGPNRSGKTALARHTFLTLVDQDKPVLYVDLRQVPENAGEAFLRTTYQSQFYGDYSLWRRKEDKPLILDNLSGRSQLIDFVVAAKEIFERILVTLPSDVFYAFFRDESRLADFDELEIANLTQVQQETLIRKRLSLTNGNSVLSDGYVDTVEDRVNSIIIDNRIVPRYPFFVLCILQTYEAYMPAGLTITSYGHCYYALIVASLVRAGISRDDSDINACFKFAEQLAFETYQHTNDANDLPFAFDEFVRRYKQKYITTNSMINRLKHQTFGIIKADGQFRTGYMRYFFLGRFLSKDNPTSREIIQRMSEATYVPANYLTLLFTIHHASDNKIIDDILLRTMVTLDNVPVATLDRVETRRFRDIVAGLPKSILSAESVEEERYKEREARDDVSNGSIEEEYTDDNEPEVQETVNGLYRVLKNNEIIGQILRNKYGSLPRDYVEEMIRVVADGGLRLVNLVLKDEHEISEVAHYIKTKYPDYDFEEIKRELGWFSFMWAMTSVESIVKCINVPEIRTSIHNVTQAITTPAYDIISYFTLLDTAPTLSDDVKDELNRLLKKHPDPFLKGVLSIRTQHYMNTHRSKTRLEQSICSSLGIKYVPRLMPPNR